MMRNRVQPWHPHVRKGAEPAPSGFGRAGRGAPLSDGLARGALHEIRCAETRGIGAAAGLALALLCHIEGAAGRPVAWIADPAAAFDAGRLYPDGLVQNGFDPGRLIVVTPRDMNDALWAADQAARCGALCAVVLHVAGNPRKLDMTATRRLMLRARASGVTALILRQGGKAEPNAASTRWEIRPAPSLREEERPPQGIGRPGFAARLERNRNGRTGAWRLFLEKGKVFIHASENDAPPHAGAPDRLDLPALPGDGPDRPAEMGQVMAFGRAS